MKKIFTLIAVALTTMGANAQTESYKPINVAADGTITLAPEFAAIIDADGNATNIVDGKSIATINTANMTVEAVGGATIANKIDPDDPTLNIGQDLVPGTLIDEEAHTYEIASVGSWNPISWKNGNNKLDINDANGTKLYFVMGTGNPYVKMFCEEVFRDGSATGTYRAQYEYYKPGMQTMPLVGLYYKFTPKVDGTLKVLIWANKGNRNTYVIDDVTKQAVTLTAEGYVNGKRANYTTPAIDPETGEQKVDNQGNPIYEQYQIFFTPEQIDSIHNDYIYGSYYRMLKANEEAAAAGTELPYTEEKLAAEKETCDANAEARKYVLSTGGQAFWGWITFRVEGGKSYWLFQDSSQVGFGGYDFTTGDEPQPQGDNLNEIVDATATENGETIVNLDGGKEYTMNAPINKANLTIAAPEGSNAKIKMEAGATFAPNSNIILKNVDIDASAISDALVQLNAEPLSASLGTGDYYFINDIQLINCNITDAPQIIYDNNVKYCAANVLIDNCVISLNNKAADKKTVIFFAQGFANNLTIKNTTISSKGTDQDYFVRYSNAGRCDRAGFESNSITYENCTFYNIAKAGQWGNYSGFAGRGTSYWTMTNNIFVDCGNGQVARRYLGGRGDQKTATFANNTYWFDGAAEETGNYDNSGTAITSDPALKDPANGDFTPTGEAQVAAKTGDPRWLNASAIHFVNTDTDDINAPIYNLAGQRVSSTTKGILIKNGKKFINR
ncbi:MAG: DUF4957 domain-containing protein [Prevotella sp.]|nr:DUF4957 domain-containing protein [Prevotella sp.]